MAVWLVRAGKNGEQQQFALENGVAVVGWNDVPNLAPARDREAVKACLASAYPGIEKGRLNNFAGQLWSFVAGIEKGDLIVLPLKSQGTIAIGEVMGAYQYQPNNPTDARHTRPVKWLKDDLPRDSLDQDLLYSIGAFMTVCRIKRNNAEARIAAILKGLPPPPPPLSTADEDGAADEEEALPNPEEQARGQLRAFLSQRYVGHKLASLVQAILEAQGFKCLTSVPGPDGGVDIIAGRGELGFDSPHLCVQVKSGAAADVKVLRELNGVMKSFGADKGLLVSWGGFRSSVMEEARRAFFDIRLWNADDVIALIQEHYERFSDSLKADLPLKRIWTLVLEE